MIMIMLHTYSGSNERVVYTTCLHSETLEGIFQSSKYGSASKMSSVSALEIVCMSASTYPKTTPNE